MSWYDTQFKNLQVARSRNKQEARRLQIELDRKHGMRAIHEYRLEEMSKEQRLVEKELERIRMGVHRIPLQGEGFAALTSRHSQSKRRLRGQDIFVTDSKNARDNVSPQSNKDNVFLKAIMYVQSDRDPQESSTENHIEHTDLTNTLSIAFDSPSVHYPGLSISPRVDNPQKNTFVDNSAPNRHIDLPVNETSVEFVPEASVDFSYSKQKLSKPLLKTNEVLVSGSPRSHPRSNISPRVKERQAGFSLDLVSLASLDMKSVKSDVTRRITQKSSSQQTTTKRAPANTDSAQVPADGELKSKERSDPVDDVAESTPDDVMDGVDVQNPDAAKAKEKSDKPRRNKPKEIDPADYNPDGSLKKMYTMPNFEDSWKEAQRARYIRHGKNSDILERERELSVKEVFDKGTKTKGANH